jgi:hypothetical protein
LIENIFYSIIGNIFDILINQETLIQGNIFLDLHIQDFTGKLNQIQTVLFENNKFLDSVIYSGFSILNSGEIIF